MFSPFLIPLVAFAVVALIVAITQLAKLRDREVEVHQSVYLEEKEHRQKMGELERELERIKQG